MHKEDFKEPLNVDLPVQIDVTQILRFMGQSTVRHGAIAVLVQKQPDLFAKITAMIKEGRQLLKPKGLYLILTAAQFCRQIAAVYPGSGEDWPQALQESDHIVLTLITLGGGYDQWLEQLACEGIMTQWIGEAIGNSALFSASSLLKRYIDGHLRPYNQQLGESWAPGDGAWPLQLQKPLMQLLGPAPLGVQMNDHLILIPLKSITQVYRVNKINPSTKRAVISDEESTDLPCRLCDHTACLFRRPK